MTVTLSSAMHTAGHWVASSLMQIVIIAVAVILAGGLTRILLLRLPLHSADSAIHRRFGRAQSVAAEHGILTGMGRIRNDFDTFEDRELGFADRVRYRHARRVLLHPTPESALRLHSHREYRRYMLRMFALRCISLFRPYEIISVESLRLLLLVGSIVLIQDEHMTTLTHRLIHFFKTTPWYSIVEWFNHWYGLVAVAVVILAVATRSPLVDRVRARDEAAKDANRLLAQLYGKLSDVTRSAYEYVEAVEQNRITIVNNAALKVTSQIYSWTYGSGMRPHDILSKIPEPSIAEETAKLEQACRELSDHLAEYRKNGLHTVANRLTRPVGSSLDKCRILFNVPELNVYLRTHLLDFPAKEIPRLIYLMQEMADVEYCGGKRTPGDLRFQADDAIRDYACDLDAKLASAYVTLLHLNHINYFLNKRLHGNTRTRLAGSFVH